MMALALTLLGAVILAAYLAVHEPAQASRMTGLKSDTLAVNFLMYQDAVEAYAAANPGASGVIADTSLRWETGYQKNPGWAALATGGHTYAYSRFVAPPGAIAAVYDTRKSMLVGTKAANGMLYNPTYGDTRIPLPAAIPTGGLVAVSSIHPGP